MITTYSIKVVAQKHTVSGVVTSDDGLTLPGVSVVEKGTRNGTVTDPDGKFTLSLAGSNPVIVVSFIGMKPQEITVGDRTTIDVTLETDLTTLEEVVVIGYGTVDRRDLTSSVSSVNNKQIKDIPVNNAAQALTGRLAGVQITAAEGSPNADIQIRVRGGGSITQDNSPIYIVDGVQVENALNVLSPQDIESIDVLKDAASTAIYGARGANGIVIITTKGGRIQKPTVSFNSLIGVRKLANKLDVWKPYDFVKYQYDRSRGNNTLEDQFLENYGTYEDIELYKDVPFTDWQDKVFGRSALMQTYNLGVTGGGKVTQYSVSLTSNTEEGIMLGSDFDRKLLNVRLDNNITKWLKIGLNGRLNHTVVNGAGTAEAGSSATNRLRHSVKYEPIVIPGQPLDYYDPEYAAETNANSLALVNPILLTKQEYKQELTKVGNINGYVSFKITDYLSFKSTLGYDNARERTRVFNDTVTNASKTNGQGLPMASITKERGQTFNNSNVLSFSSAGLKSIFGEKHKLDMIIGHELYERDISTDFLDSRFFPRNTSPGIAFGQMGELGEIQATSRLRKSEEKLLSYFTRVNYSFNDKYLVTLSYRRDGSSKFADGKRWGSFPGASLAWRISNEPFFSPLSNVVSEMKIRTSYGASGNNRIPNYLYYSIFQLGQNGSFYSFDEQLQSGYSPVSLANNNLVWESIVSQNVGIDAGFFNNRVQLSVDYYNNQSKDLLLERVVPSSSGYSTQIQNVGKTSNKGVEIQLSGTPVTRGDFSWNAGFNISFNKNKIESLGPGLKSFPQPSGWSGSSQTADYIAKVGESVGTIWGFQTDGFYKIEDFTYEAATQKYTLKDGIANNKGITSLDPVPGMIKFKDITPDNVINDADRTIIGNASPKFFGGLNQQFAYKNFDLSVFVNFQYGNDVLNANKLEFTSGYTPRSNLLTIMDGRWTNVNAEGQVVTDPAALADLNKDATIWSPLTTASSFVVHSWAVEDASFIRINNITLGYTLPQSIFSKIKINSFRVYGTLNNLAVFSNYSGYDPEVNTRRNSPLTPGVDYSAYPRSRGYIFGLNITF
ncbi:SusC/RagA family TonB-linked outer membrane protein [Chryseosolibacter indicus]|uniref:TonB-dependent receptor n=1 Tax=Chryseosolibacter indicus TaxID=2782351 RepID=A0ABS5VVA9_9BACT|nr:TonB-dependent receptor [Chryseosolibacter indicus]MBT1703936.1 TonB-dependent receptor [Chryseosolibacter indicus]